MIKFFTQSNKGAKHAKRQKITTQNQQLTTAKLMYKSVSPAEIN
jgi:hypothetical protein